MSDSVIARLDRFVKDAEIERCVAAFEHESEQMLVSLDSRLQELFKPFSDMLEVDPDEDLESFLQLLAKVPDPQGVVDYVVNELDDRICAMTQLLRDVVEEGE